MRKNPEQFYYYLHNVASLHHFLITEFFSRIKVIINACFLEDKKPEDKKPAHICISFLKPDACFV
jgi:hypothetical protein